nr:DNA polymerase III subunit beta [uncultured Solibaculum sp.]
MQITCQRQPLLDAATSVQRAVSTKSSIPALEGILLETKEGELSLSGFDLELGIVTSIEATVQEKGALVVSARLFVDIIRKMDSDNVSIQTDEKNLIVIQGGQAEFSIMGTPAAEFAELPSLKDGTEVTLPQNLLAGMLRQTLFAVAQTDNKPIYTGVLFELEQNLIRLVALDGYRLAIREEPVSVDSSFRFVAPGKTLSEVLRLLGDDDQPVTITVGSRHIFFSINRYSVVSRLLDGEFLDYKKSVPQGGSTQVRVKTRALIDSIERASLLISDRLKSPVRCIFEEDEIRISCVTTAGKVRDQVEASLEGDRVEIGFNHKYLLDALRASESDEVRVVLSGPVAPMKVLPVEGEHFLFLVLPVRLKNEI